MSCTVLRRSVCFGMSHLKNYRKEGRIMLYSLTTYTWVAACWVQFPNHAIYIGQLRPFFSALLGFLPWGLLIFIRLWTEQIKPCKSCNLKPKICRLHREFNSGSKASLPYAVVHRWWFANYIVAVACQNKASIILCASSIGSRPLALIWQNIGVREPWYSGFGISLSTTRWEDDISPLSCYSADLPATGQSVSFVKSNRFLLYISERETFYLMYFMTASVV
jgi:hypothetical protein